MLETERRFRSVRYLPCFLSVLWAIIFMWGCGNSSLTAGGSGTEDGNASIVSGRIIAVQADLTGTVVRLVPMDFNPIIGHLADSLSRISDEKGLYSFHLNDTGTYRIEAVLVDGSLKALTAPIHVSGGDVKVSDAVLKPAGNISVSLPDFAAGLPGYLFIRGSTSAVRFSGVEAVVNFSGVPAADMSVVLVLSGSGITETIEDDVAVPAEGTVDVGAYSAWKYSSALAINTSSTGADIAEDLYGFPLLVRFSASNLDFGQVRPDGSDIRFSKTDGTPLAFEIEEWDALNEAGAVWVRVDTVFGDNAGQSFMMHWGSAYAEDRSDGPAVFGGGSGFVSVLHLGETAANGTDIFRDASAVGNHGTAVSFSRDAAVQGVAGKARLFDGIDDHIFIPSASSLDFGKGDFTISLFARVDTAALRIMELFGRDSLPGTGYMEMQVFAGSEKLYPSAYFRTGAMYDSIQAPPVGQWTCFALRRSSGSVSLLVNGVPAGPALALSDSAVSDAALFLGIYKGNPALDEEFFKGIMDEFRISAVARSDNWLKFSYRSQRPGSAIVSLE